MVETGPKTRTDSEAAPEMLELENKPPRAASVLELTVQGRGVSYPGSPDVRSLLEFLGEDAVYVNVRINGSILNRRDFENIPLSDGDRVDFLYFMGGGACCLTCRKKRLNATRGTSSCRNWAVPASRS
ncbi:MAG: sulfur carrier protein ThiS [Thermoleophilia bacterium]